MTEQEDNNKLEEQLKAALWFSVGKMVDEETLRLGVNATPQFIGSLTELVWTQIENISHDLESFSKHAKRSVVTVEDVMLLARRNEELEKLLQKLSAKQVAGKKERA